MDDHLTHFWRGATSSRIHLNSPGQTQYQNFIFQIATSMPIGKKDSGGITTQSSPTIQNVQPMRNIK